MGRVRARRLLGVLAVLVLVLVTTSSLWRSPASLPPESGCTLVVNVFTRPSTVADSLRHYAQSASLARVVLLWAGPADANETELAEAAGTLPLSLVFPPSSSLNWRFYPWPEIRTECIISMDDDWRMPIEHIDRVSQVWHAGYQDRWVGLEHMGRNHVLRDLPDGAQHQPVYAPTFWSQYAAQPAIMPPSKFHSIVLPSGAALSRRYFEAYHEPRWAAARAVVDEITNCEDLLMNYVVANLTGGAVGPAFVRAWAKPFQVDGLWFRPKHLGTRSECLQRFAALTETQLVYSDAYIPLDADEAGTPLRTPFRTRPQSPSTSPAPARYSCATAYCKLPFTADIHLSRALHISPYPHALALFSAYRVRPRSHSCTSML